MGKSRNGFVVVTTTIDRRARAEKLARQIVARRLAACVQYTAIHSVYRWKGSVESTGEFLLIAKTRAALSKPLVSFVRSVHPYEVPEIVVTPIAGGLKEYLDWVRAEVRVGRE
jgi:periplasmic divalent cation tolerance protein